jgi:hypothetical protein
VLITANTSGEVFQTTEESEDTFSAHTRFYQ